MTSKTWDIGNKLIVGRDGMGTLYVKGDGKVLSTWGTIAYNTGSNGTVNVTGKGSTWTNSYDLIVGDYATGTLNIENGGEVSGRIGIVGYHTGSNGTVNVIGQYSTWTNHNDLFVGGGDYEGNSNGTGTLNIKGGGKASGRVSTIGYGVNSKGTVNVTGKGSTWTNRDLNVGYAGTGTLNIENAGLVTVTGNYTQGSRGTLSFALGELFADTILDIVGNVDFASAIAGSVAFDFTDLVLSGEEDVFVGMTWGGTATGMREDLFSFGDWTDLNLTGWEMSAVYDLDDKRAGWQFTWVGVTPELPIDPPSGTPEPATLLMLGLGLGVIPFARRFRKK